MAFTLGLTSAMRSRCADTTSRAENSFDGGERSLELTRGTGHELGVLGQLARYERSFSHRLEQPGRRRRRQIFFAQRRDGVRRVVAFDRDPKATLDRRVGFFFAAYPRPLEGDHHPVGLPFLEPAGDGHGAP